MRKDTSVAQIGLDNHYRFSKATARDERGDVVWRERLEHADREQLRERLRHWPAGTPVVLEGTFGWGWMSDELQAAGLEPHLASSRKVAAWRDGQGMAKTNRLDSDLLSTLWSEKQPWWEIWLAPPEVREQREWMRYRMSLVQVQTATKCRMHAVLHRHGIVQDFSDLFGVEGRRFLEGLLARDDALPGSARATLSGNLRLLEYLRKQLARVTREVRKQLTRFPEGEVLRSLPGISWILAHTIFAEVGRFERFRKGRQLAKYSLLAPLNDDSGDEDRRPRARHIGQAGRRTLKWAWMEAAHGAVRKSAHFRRIFDRVTDGGKRNRNRGYVAVAHELCLLAHRLCLRGELYQEELAGRARREPKQPTEGNGRKISSGNG